MRIGIANCVSVFAELAYEMRLQWLNITTLFPGYSSEFSGSTQLWGDDKFRKNIFLGINVAKKVGINSASISRSACAD